MSSNKGRKPFEALLFLAVFLLLYVVAYYRSTKSLEIRKMIGIEDGVSVLFHSKFAFLEHYYGILPFWTGETEGISTSFYRNLENECGRYYSLFLTIFEKRKSYLNHDLDLNEYDLLRLYNIIESKGKNGKIPVNHLLRKYMKDFSNYTTGNRGRIEKKEMEQIEKKIAHILRKYPSYFTVTNSNRKKSRKIGILEVNDPSTILKSSIYAMLSRKIENISGLLPLEEYFTEFRFTFLMLAAYIVLISIRKQFLSHYRNIFHVLNFVFGYTFIFVIKVYQDESQNVFLFVSSVFILVIIAYDSSNHNRFVKYFGILFSIFALYSLKYCSWNVGISTNFLIQNFLYKLVVGIVDDEEELHKNLNKNVFASLGYIFFFPTLSNGALHPKIYLEWMKRIMDKEKFMFAHIFTSAFWKNVVFHVVVYYLAYGFSTRYEKEIKESFLDIFYNGQSDSVYHSGFYSILKSSIIVCFSYRCYHYWRYALLVLGPLTLGFKNEDVLFAHILNNEYGESFYITMRYWNVKYHKFSYHVVYKPLLEVIPSKVVVQFCVSFVALIFHEVCFEMIFFWVIWIILIEMEREYYRKWKWWRYYGGKPVTEAYRPMMESIKRLKGKSFSTHVMFWWCYVFYHHKVPSYNLIQVCFSMHGIPKFEIWQFGRKKYFLPEIYYVLRLVVFKLWDAREDVEIAKEGILVSTQTLDIQKKVV